MLIENQVIEVKFNRIHKKNREYFSQKGYEPVNGIIFVKAEDLNPTSNKKVKLSCDYCNLIIEWEYAKCIKEEKHCCKKCIYRKAKETNLKKYGFENPSQIPHIKNKIKETVKKKYGVCHIGSSKELHLKQQQTMLERYGVKNAYQLKKVRETTIKNHGVEYPFQSKKIREKQKETMIKKYGVANPTQNKEIMQKVFTTNLSRYGVKSPLQFKEFQEKATINMLKTMYKNGTVQTSTQQIHLHNLIGGELNYPVDQTSLDIALLDEKIDIEYNGGGHYAWPIFNGLSQEEISMREMNRYSYLKSRGWKLIRIICKSDKLYSDDKIFKLIEECRFYLSLGHSWIEIDIDLNILRCSQFKKDILFNKGGLEC